MREQQYMELALELAARAKGRTSPNPLVGCVIVRDGEIVGQGYHQKAGTPHAEVHALREAGERALGATVYVTLEPCSHYGRTPPCAEALIEAGVKRVVAAMTDPNPLVAGRGLQRLQEAGIEVEVGLLEEAARKLNEGWIYYMERKLPFIIWKYAMTLDGKTATSAGDSRWISGGASRLLVHQLRNEVDAIMIGSGTLLADDPALTTRLPAGGRDAVRIIVDSRGRTPLTARVVEVTKTSSAPTVIATTAASSAVWRRELQKAGAEVLVLPQQQGRADLMALMRELAGRGIVNILLESGGELAWSLLSAGLIRKVYAFIAPKLVGGQSAPTPLGGKGVDRMAMAFPCEKGQWQQLDQDLLYIGYLSREVSECSPES